MHYFAVLAPFPFTRTRGASFLFGLEFCRARERIRGTGELYVEETGRGGWAAAGRSCDQIANPSQRGERGTYAVSWASTDRYRSRCQVPSAFSFFFLLATMASRRHLTCASPKISCETAESPKAVRKIKI